MYYTQHYQLPQWEKSDRILMDDFNDAMEKIEGGLEEKIGATFGTYKGNGSSSRKISLGFTPTAVYICTREGLAGYSTGSRYCYGGLMAQGSPLLLSGTKAAEVVDGGFKVYKPNDYIRINVSGEVYHYLAFR